MSETEELLKERIFSLQRHKEEAEQVKYELKVSLQRLSLDNARLKERLAGCRDEEHKLHRQLCAKDDEIASLQEHVAELASTNARLQRRTTSHESNARSEAAVTGLQRLISQWFEEFRRNTNLKISDQSQNIREDAAISHFQALLAALVSVLQVAQSDLAKLSPPPLYLDLLRRSLYAGQAQLQQTDTPSFMSSSDAAAPEVAVGGRASQPSAVAQATAVSDGQPSQPSGFASGAPPPMLQALGDRPLPRREDGAASVWGFLFGGGEGGFALSGINNAESTHVLPV